MLTSVLAFWGYDQSFEIQESKVFAWSFPWNGVSLVGLPQPVFCPVFSSPFENQSDDPKDFWSKDWREGRDPIKG